MKFIEQKDLPPDFQAIFDKVFCPTKKVPIGNCMFHILSTNFKKRTITLELDGIAFPEESDLQPQPTSNESNNPTNQ